MELGWRADSLGSPKENRSFCGVADYDGGKTKQTMAILHVTTSIKSSACI